MSTACLGGSTGRQAQLCTSERMVLPKQCLRFSCSPRSGQIALRSSSKPQIFLLCTQEVSGAADAQLMQQGERIKKKMTAPKTFPRVAMDLATTVERIQQNFCICDPNLPDNPIVFASDGFLEMSQYDRYEVLGRNCRFLQVRYSFRLFLGSNRVPKFHAIGICNEYCSSTCIQGA